MCANVPEAVILLFLLLMLLLLLFTCKELYFRLLTVKMAPFYHFW